MRTLIFVPTFRLGGLDVLEGSLGRQTDQNFDVLVCDTLFEQRYKEWSKMETKLSISIDACPGPPKRDGYKRNLASSYNFAAEYAIRHGYDLFISLQDYIWIPQNGVERFVEAFQKRPEYLLTGITHISSDPTPSASWPDGDPENFYYTIFDKPYMNKPEQIDWVDCRIQGVYEYFACLAHQTTGCLTVMDTRNQAVSLPHKKYFAGEEEEIIEFSNRGMFEETWGPRF